MLLSRAYQRTHRTVPGNEKGETLYSHATVRVIAPESFYDCLVIASGGELKDDRATIDTAGSRAKGETLGSRADFLKLFATTDADGSPTDYTHGIPQALALLNERATNATARLVEQAVKEKGGDEAIVTRVYVGVLSRRPTAEEWAIVREFLGRRPSDPGRYQAVWWALVNSPEFAMVR
jgi:hypothetical protein